MRVSTNITQTSVVCDSCHCVANFQLYQAWQILDTCEKVTGCIAGVGNGPASGSLMFFTPLFPATKSKTTNKLLELTGISLVWDPFSCMGSFLGNRVAPSVGNPPHQCYFVFANTRVFTARRLPCCTFWVK